MAELQVQTLDRTWNGGGTTPRYFAADAAGDYFTNIRDGSTFLHVKNASNASISVTVIRQKMDRVQIGDEFYTLTSLVVAIPANSEKMVGPFADTFNDLQGKARLSYSDVTSLTIAALGLQLADMDIGLPGGYTYYVDANGAFYVNASGAFYVSL